MTMQHGDHAATRPLAGSPAQDWPSHSGLRFLPPLLLLVLGILNGSGLTPGQSGSGRGQGGSRSAQGAGDWDCGRARRQCAEYGLPP